MQCTIGSHSASFWSCKASLNFPVRKENLSAGTVTRPLLESIPYALTLNRFGDSHRRLTEGGFITLLIRVCFQSLLRLRHRQKVQLRRTVIEVIENVRLCLGGQSVGIDTQPMLDHIACTSFFFFPPGCDQWTMVPNFLITFEPRDLTLWNICFGREDAHDLAVIYECE